MEPGKIVYLMRGLPSSGKSYTAKQLAGQRKRKEQVTGWGLETRAASLIRDEQRGPIRPSGHRPGRPIIMGQCPRRGAREALTVMSMVRVFLKDV